jgi:hypothetical protein
VRWGSVGALVVVAASAIGACTSEGSSADGAPSTPALAPSQISAETAPPPAAPPPCDAAELAFWTARVVVGSGAADAVIRVRNDGAIRCEADISRSPSIDPAIEPDVWLEPGGWADLVLGQTGEGCDDPEAVTSVEIDVGESLVTVPTAALATCGAWLTAFYPSDSAAVPCSDLEVLAVESFVLVRNDATVSCRLGELVDVSAGRASATITGARPDRSRPAVVDLARDDVVGFPSTHDPGDFCPPTIVEGTLTFDIAGAVSAELPACSRFELGPGRPWYGDPAGPVAGLTNGPPDVEAVLQALDPFPGGAG